MFGAGTDTFQVQTIRHELKNVSKDAEQDHSRIYKNTDWMQQELTRLREAKDRTKGVLHEKSCQQTSQEDQDLCSAKNNKKAQDSRRGDRQRKTDVSA